MGDHEAIARGLRAVLGNSFGVDDVLVTGIRRLGGGSSRENWSFEVSSAAAGISARPLLLRRDPPASVAETDRVAEVGVLSALVTSPVPSPRILASDLDGIHLARPSVIMERAPGLADRSVLRRRDPLALGAAGRVALAERLCELLAEVHRLDPASGGLTELLGPPPPDPAAHEVARWTAEIARTRTEPLPELAYVGLWLRERLPPPPARAALVHGDFRPANVLVAGGQPGTLLDWEFAHLGDPAEDVGWYTAPIYRNEHFGEEATWTPDAFLRRYRERLGPDADEAIDPARVRFWQVLALYKLSAIAVAGVHSFLHGGSDRAAEPPDRVLRLAVVATMERS